MALLTTIFSSLGPVGPTGLGLEGTPPPHSSMPDQAMCSGGIGPIPEFSTASGGEDTPSWEVQPDAPQGRPLMADPEQAPSGSGAGDSGKFLDMQDVPQAAPSSYLQPDSSTEDVQAPDPVQGSLQSPSAGERTSEFSVEAGQGSIQSLDAGQGSIQALDSTQGSVQITEDAQGQPPPPDAAQGRPQTLQAAQGSPQTPGATWARPQSHDISPAGCGVP
jgi:hypothetical protein